MRSARALGSSIRNVQVIWLARCALDDLEGITACKRLTELYVAFNNIRDLSPLVFADETLAVLDLEGFNDRILSASGGAG